MIHSLCGYFALIAVSRPSRPSGRR
jgi:hypothetical protein